MKTLIAVAVLLCVLALVSPSLSLSYGSQDMEERNDGGFMDVLKGFSDILKSIIGLIEGTGKVDDLTAAIQKLFYAVEKLINLQNLLSKVPFVGAYLAPVAGGIGTLMADTPMLGGLISNLLIGPSAADYP
ncbi:uncharacterized protein LOC126889571 [Diabrotica virgifera virgifera]|uniref:Uncharacterized protein n=1 Tax=Diabrotica virgifera virgifera TaxID=50390 RepID=A0ABM5KUP7_DIAVI|nr:uncharacterized protein LOC126889571 [Diabrotica virgifera virgifera]